MKPEEFKAWLALMQVAGKINKQGDAAPLLGRTEQWVTNCRRNGIDKVTR
ncbi:hypothetical protein [Rhizobium mayense]|uniref:Uncharacterized protein n=1 Tax=Rhizobium mayense TaxID=1312184 RepID=A0ABT7JRV3_9HYPH|nr:hypothetical protein [Rhizobium mayense]MDL2398433.1 hypothetical protein [Rhizobium mayense]